MASAPLSLADDQMCIGCGSRNPHGLRLAFELDRPHQRLTTAWTPAKYHQGYTDIVHGGMLALVLDELMGNLLWQLERPAVTAELTVRFRRPAKVGEPLVCQAQVESEERRSVWMTASATTSDGAVVADARARYVQVKSASHKEGT
ncbi:MAG: hypothetical protein A3C53_06720 [Omnitrophica WOR_2 bacterium RIFCSPHIGHO2_02_FULL_68_15]|nr:MAG: hypothetical protein A3C53_06720 [Omnitrophica WOR_2 bacterium RIFCSPHIGHO2_02_FULL_68_15]